MVGDGAQVAQGWGAGVVVGGLGWNWASQGWWVLPWSWVSWRCWVSEWCLGVGAMLGVVVLLLSLMVALRGAAVTLLGVTVALLGVRVVLLNAVAALLGVTVAVRGGVVPISAAQLQLLSQLCSAASFKLICRDLPLCGAV